MDHIQAKGKSYNLSTALEFMILHKVSITRLYTWMNIMRKNHQWCSACVPENEAAVEEARRGLWLTLRAVVTVTMKHFISNEIW